MTRVPERPFAVTSVRAGKGVCALLLASSMAVLTGCSKDTDRGDDAKVPLPSSSSASPTAQASPRATVPPSATADTGVAAVIEDVYRKYWQEKTKAYAQASVEGTELKKYAVAQAYTSAETEVKALRNKGLVTKGTPLIAPEVTSVDTSRQVPRGSLTDCTDVSNWALVRKSDGQAVSLPEGRRTKYVTRVVAEKWYGRWVIVQVSPEDRSC